MAQIIAMASRESYDGIELRFVQGEDSLWKLPVFSGKGLAATKRELADRALSISCLDTSCRFHSPDAAERGRWITEGKRMADLAAELGAPGLRVFGDTIQAGADRASTQRWIAESIRELAEITAERGVEVWIENHGDFAGSHQTAAILAASGLSEGRSSLGPGEQFRCDRGAAPRTVLRGWELRFAMFTSRICAETEMAGNMSCLERAISPCLN